MLVRKILQTIIVLAKDYIIEECRDHQKINTANVHWTCTGKSKPTNTVVSGAEPLREKTYVMADDEVGRRSNKECGRLRRWIKLYDFDDGYADT